MLVGPAVQSEGGVLRGVLGQEGVQGGLALGVHLHDTRDLLLQISGSQGLQSLIFSIHLIQQGPVVAVRGQLEAGVGHGHQDIEAAPGASNSRNQFTPIPHLFT